MCMEVNYKCRFLGLSLLALAGFYLHVAVELAWLLQQARIQGGATEANAPTNSEKLHKKFMLISVCISQGNISVQFNETA